MNKTDPIIRTKLHLPFVRPGLVSRPRLQEQIVQGLCVPLTLITAPAGFGKTTLVASCVAGCGMQAAWLSLDKDDNQAGRFMTYLIAALQGVDNRIGSEAAQLIMEMEQVPPEVVLTSLINDLDAVTGEMVLVLDDYQFITSQSVHEEVAFLLEHSPKTFHLVIATRSDPPLPLSRLRARGQMVELRTADLRFTASEAARFLNDVMGLSLDAGSVALLEERTEGWIASLQMAALSLKHTPDVKGFIRTFSGSNRFVMDYLMEEVLNLQPQSIQDFLLQTSILERLNSPLCDAVCFSDRDVNEQKVFGSNGSVGQAQEMLEFLERSILFIIPLDDERKWFRYHHLFAGLLRARLTHSKVYPIKTLHLRAVDWFEQNGYPEDAIHHALAAQDFQRAARLIESIAETLWLNGEYYRLTEWIKALPRDLVRSHPWLCVWNAWSLSQIGTIEDTNAWVGASEEAAQKQNLDPSASPTALALKYNVTALKVLIACLEQDFDRANELAAWVLESPLPKDDKLSLMAGCHILHGLSYKYFADGDITKTEQVCLEIIQISKEIGFTLRLIHAANKLAYIYKTAGRLRQCYQFLQDTLSYLQEQGNENYFAAGVLRCRWVELLYEWDRLEEARYLLEDYLDPERLAKSPYLLIDYYNICARDLLLKKDFHGAQSALNKAAAQTKQFYIWSALTWPTEALQVRLWLQNDNIALATAWASSHPADTSELLPFASESNEMARSRILLAGGACQEAIHLLDRLAASAEKGGRLGSLVEILTLESIALHEGDHAEQAVVTLEKALSLAEREGYARTFIDEGDPVAVLLAKIVHENRSPHVLYARRLLARMESEKGNDGMGIPALEAQSRLPHQIPDSIPIEPLSRRELEVLRCMAAGLSNHETAKQLVIETSTVKRHINSIFAKLGVNNRVQALNKAKEYKII